MLRIKRGDTLTLHGQLLQDGAPVDVSGWQIDCWVRDPAGRLVHQFVPAITDGPAGEYQLAASAAQTSGWPVARLRTDLRFAGGGAVMHTCTLEIDVLEAVTTP